MAPSMTPPDVRERWAKSLADFVQTKDFQTKLLQIGMEQKYLPAEETAEWLNSERKKWESVIVKNNINAE
jgi:tripartite-type tricarboxylate transporter receptor subunit TctC